MNIVSATVTSPSQSYSLQIDHLQVLLQSPLIMASKSISKLAGSRPPSASPNSLAHVLQVHLWDDSLMTSKCISKLDRSRHPSSHNHGLHVHLQTRSIMASKSISEFNLISASRCILKLARSRPPSASLRSTRSRPPSASPNLLDRGLHVHLSVHRITAFKCISMFSQSASPGAHEITLQYHLPPDWPYVYIYRET